MSRCTSFWLLPLLLVLAASTAPPPAPAQTQPAPAPTNPVAIENTNAAFSPTDVTIPQANPARPTITIPAHLPPTGYLQFEQGFNHAGSSPGGTPAQNAISQTTKIALTTRLLVQFLTEPYAYSTLSGPHGGTTGSNDPGDLQVGFEAVIHKAVGAFPTASLGYIRRVRAGTSANIDLGEYSQSALILLGGDLRGGFHYDSNILFNEQNNGPVRRPQFGQTLAISHLLFPVSTKQRLGATVELSHFTQPFISATAAGVPIARANTFDVLFVTTYALRPNLILDASVSRGVTSTSTAWQGDFGFSYILPHRLWPDKHPVPIPVGPIHYSGR